ncbi:MAG TPA: beta-N-acetylhexosaminidase, partial [Steroidobacteraceae bacterium]|nr:beta-N-acetylhexosaminidase [Steroidobacteraceae bacterium]
EDRRVLAHPLVGAVILFTRNFQSLPQLESLVREIHAVRTPPLVVAVDQEGGRVQRFREGFTRLPSQRSIGHLHEQDPEAGRRLAWQCGWLLAAELRAVGIDLSFAPCVDLDYGVCEAIGDRAYHRDPETVARLAVACMQGMRTAGMAATAKHFPGHGAVVADSHKALPVDRRPLAELTDELLPYRRLIANGLSSVMVAHVLFPEVDEAPASLSRRWIRQELRWGLGFAGAVFSDDLSMGGAAGVGAVPERARRAMAAGCDVLAICNDRNAVLATLEELAGESDPLSQIRLARLHGRPAPGRAELEQTARWAECRRAIERCMEAPSLQLNA